jgi:hypothetical protein
MRGDVREDSVKKGVDVELRRAGGARNAGRQGAPIPNFDTSIPEQARYKGFSPIDTDI